MGTSVTIMKYKSIFNRGSVLYTLKHRDCQIYRLLSVVVSCNKLRSSWDAPFYNFNKCLTTYIYICLFWWVQESLRKEYENCKFHPPYRQAMYYCSLLLEEHTWPWNEELEALQHVEPNDLLLFTPVLLRKTYLECYMSGLHLNHWYVRSCT
jgi:Middle or third domain of peptidase_M16